MPKIFITYDDGNEKDKKHAKKLANELKKRLIYNDPITVMPEK